MVRDVTGGKDFLDQDYSHLIICVGIILLFVILVGAVENVEKRKNGRGLRHN
jgi:uncharacterized integral membrane protein